MFRIVLLCVSVSALKLLADPEFEVEGALYDAECGDRYNFKCWRKGGHSLEKEEAAYVSALAWKAPSAPDATAGWAKLDHEVTMTWNKKVDVVGTPKISGQECDADKTSNCATASALEMVTAETSPGGAKTIDFSKGSAIPHSAISYQHYYRVAAQSIVVSSGQSIKNAGKKKNANLAFTQQTTQVQATNTETPATITGVAWGANTLPWDGLAPAPVDDETFDAEVIVTWSKIVTVQGASVTITITQAPYNGNAGPGTYNLVAAPAADTATIAFTGSRAVGETAAGDKFAVLAQDIALGLGNTIKNGGNWNSVSSTMDASRTLQNLPAQTTAMVAAYTQNAACAYDSKLYSPGSYLATQSSCASLATCYGYCEADACKYFDYNSGTKVCHHDNSGGPPGENYDAELTDSTEAGAASGYLVYVSHGNVDLVCP